MASHIKPDWKFGDLICYRLANKFTHDEPVMFVSVCQCPDQDRDLIHLLPIGPNDIPHEIEHKAPEVWQWCHHIDRNE